MTADEPPNQADTAAGYDQLAGDPAAVEDWASPWGDSPYQQHYVWPAIQRLLPDVAGKHVLDAGCGTGHYTEWFLDNGASVTGVDASAAALSTAKDRCEDATVYHHDLADRFEFADADTFDVVFSNLVLGHIEDWTQVFEEFARVLAPDGVVVLSTIHPLRRFLNHRDQLASYHETEGYVVEWGNTDAEVVSYYRPLEAVVMPLVNAGFHITAFREVKPEPEFEAHDPERYDYAMTRPDTLCVRAELAETDSA